MAYGLRLKVQGLGFMVWDLRFGIKGLQYLVPGPAPRSRGSLVADSVGRKGRSPPPPLPFRVSGLGFRVYGLGFSIWV